MLALSVMALAGCSAETWLEGRLSQSGDLSPWGVAAIVFGGTFFSEDLACVSAGVWASRESIPYWGAALVCTVGVWFSDSVLYFWGVLGRRGLLDRAPLKWIIKHEKVERGTALFELHGAKMIVLSRFLPGSRLPLYVSAGLLRYPYRRFAAWMALAAVMWAPIMVWLAMKLGNALLGWLEMYEKAAWFVIPAVVLAIWGVMKGLEWMIGRRTHLLDEPEVSSGAEKE